jgi:hypothetical protein
MRQRKAFYKEESSVDPVGKRWRAWFDLAGRPLLIL